MHCLADFIGKANIYNTRSSLGTKEPHSGTNPILRGVKGVDVAELRDKVVAQSNIA